MECQNIGDDLEGDKRRHSRALYCKSVSAVLLEYHVGVGPYRSRLQAETAAYGPTWEIWCGAKRRKCGWVVPSAHTRCFPSTALLPSLSDLLSTSTFRDLYQLILPQAGCGLSFFFFLPGHDLLMLQFPFLLFDHQLSWQRELQRTIYYLFTFRYWKRYRRTGQWKKCTAHRQPELWILWDGQPSGTSTWFRDPEFFGFHNPWICTTRIKSNPLDGRRGDQDAGSKHQLTHGLVVFGDTTQLGTQVTSVEQEMLPSLQVQPGTEAQG